MSKLEEITYEAYELGLRDALFKEVSTIRMQSRTLKLEDVYELALERVKANSNPDNTIGK